MTLSVLRVAAVGAALLAISPASAQSVRSLGDFRDWAAYATSESSGTVCFAVSKPTDVDPTPDGFTDAYLYLTHRPGENVSNEINLVAGYTFAADSKATLSVGGREFALFTDRDAAWLDDPEQSETLAGVLRAGSSLTIEGTSDKGIKIVETFSLSGATAASRAIDGEC